MCNNLRNPLNTWHALQLAQRRGATEQSNATASESEQLAALDTSEQEPATLPPPPTLEAMLNHVASQSPLMRQSVSLHRKSAAGILAAAQRRRVAVQPVLGLQPRPRPSNAVLSRYSLAVAPSVTDVRMHGGPGGHKEGHGLQRRSMHVASTAEHGCDIGGGGEACRPLPEESFSFNVWEGGTARASADTAFFNLGAECCQTRVDIEETQAAETDCTSMA